MLQEISEFRVEADHRLWVRFKDGVEGTVDLSGLIGHGVFAPLVDQAMFAGVAIDEFGALCWPNGADLAPDAMHAALRTEGNWRPALTAAMPA